MDDSSNPKLILIPVGVVLLLVLGYVSFRGGDERVPPAAPPKPASTTETAPAPAIETAPEPDPERGAAPTVEPIVIPGSAGAFLPSVAPGKAITVLASDLPETGPLTMTLELPHVHEGEPLWGRVITEGRHIEIQGVLDRGDGSVAHVDIPTDWLTPGTYLIDMHVRERSAVPTRRYVLVVR